MLVESVPFWTIDSGATDHIVRDGQPLWNFIKF
jgi:hypothetical protein